MLQQIPDCHLELGRYRAVQEAVVEGQGEPQDLMLGDVALVLHHQLILRAHAQNGGVGLVDDGVKLSMPNIPRLDTEKVEPLYSSAQLVGTGPLRQILALADRASRLMRSASRITGTMSPASRALPCPGSHGPGG